MPKLEEEDFIKRKNHILNTTFQLTLHQPINTISIRNIIRECKISQGSIYTYFKNIDEIYIALINKETSSIDFKKKIDTILTADTVAEKTILQYILFLNECMLETILGIGKIYYELINIYANDKLKLEHFLKGCHISSEYTYMNDAFSNYISEKIETGYFHTEITTNEIQDYITIFFDGITRNLILAKYYNSDEILKKPNFHKDELIHMLYRSIICFLNGDTEKGVD